MLELLDKHFGTMIKVWDLSNKLRIKVIKQTAFDFQFLKFLYRVFFYKYYQICFVKNRISFQ